MNLRRIVILGCMGKYNNFITTPFLTQTLITRPFEQTDTNEL